MKPQTKTAAKTTAKTSAPTKQALSYLLNTVKQHPLGITVMLLTACVFAINLSVAPYLLKIILNRVNAATAETTFAVLAAPIIWYLLMAALIRICFRAYNYFV